MALGSSNADVSKYSSAHSSPAFCAIAKLFRFCSALDSESLCLRKNYLSYDAPEKLREQLLARAASARRAAANYEAARPLRWRELRCKRPPAPANGEVAN